MKFRTDPALLLVAVISLTIGAVIYMAFNLPIWICALIALAFYISGSHAAKSKRK